MGVTEHAGGLSCSIISFGTEAILQKIPVGCQIAADSGWVPIWVYDAWHASWILRQCRVPVHAIMVLLTNKHVIGPQPFLMLS